MPQGPILWGGVVIPPTYEHTGVAERSGPRQSLPDFQPGPEPALRSSRKNRSLRACAVVVRAISAMLEVRGMPFGQAFTQLAALPQSLMPPRGISACRRSDAFILPVGWLLKRRTWEMAAGPMNAVV